MDFNPHKPIPPCPPPDLPDFCPPPQHPHHGGGMPPVPSVVEGQSLYEAMNTLTDRVNTCIKTYNEVMSHSYAALDDLRKAAQENGAYYGPCEVWTEPGYYADESASYTLVFKNVVDRRCQPIRVQLKLAYGNTTNSAVEQNIMSASKAHFADKIVIAQPIPEDKKGWYGKTILNGCPIPSIDKPELYTVGFTKSGVMRVYNNSVTIDQMLRDTIDDSMGCSGVLVQHGEVCADSYLQKIPNWDKQVARVAVGQNLNTRQVIFLTCGNENDVNKKGMTSKAVANVLRQYGCDIAVELCEGTGSMAMDKGQLMYEPSNETIPNGYAFWVISRAHFYMNDYERELALLLQNYGENLWNLKTTRSHLDRVEQTLYSEVERLDGRIDTETAERIEADTKLANDLAAEIERALAAEQANTTLIQQEAARAAAAEAKLDSDIKNEAKLREAGDEDNKARIESEAQRAADAEKALSELLAQETSRAEAAEKRLGTDLDTEVNRAKDEEARLQKAVDAEQLRAATAERDLGDAIRNEASIREQADTTIRDLINQEAMDRANADNSLRSAITDLNTTVDKKLAEEVAERQEVETQLKNLIDSNKTDIESKLADEKSERLAQDSVLQTHIDEVEHKLHAEIADEARDRQARDAELDTKITNVTISLNNSVKEQNERIQAVEERMDTVEQKMEALDPDTLAQAAADKVGEDIKQGTITLPPATENTPGAVKPGPGMTVDTDGTLHFDYELKPATADTLGGIKVGAGLSVAEDGTLSTAAPTIDTITDEEIDSMWDE